jgi:hypothetical protein
MDDQIFHYYDWLTTCMFIQKQCGLTSQILKRNAVKSINLFPPLGPDNSGSGNKESQKHI